MSTLEALQELLIKEYTLTREQVAPEALLATLGVDSLGMIELMIQLEERFGITLSEDTPPILATVNELAAYMDRMVVAHTTVPAAGAAAAAPIVP
jgi:acyl carrier protein